MDRLTNPSKLAKQYNIAVEDEGVTLPLVYNEDGDAVDANIDTNINVTPAMYEPTQEVGSGGGLPSYGSSLVDIQGVQGVQGPMDFAMGVNLDVKNANIDSALGRVAGKGATVNEKRVSGKRVNPITGKSGNKAFRNNNPGNITGMGGKLLYGAVAIVRNPHGDKGDQAQLVFKTPEDGFKAMHRLMIRKYNYAPIKVAFSKWQTDKKMFANILKAYTRAGIDINKK